MNWSVNGKELRDASDHAEIVTALNLCAKAKVANKTPYYLLPDHSDTHTISNVPPCIYEKEALNKYVAPLNESISHQFVVGLQNCIDMVQDEFNKSNRCEYFQLNQCFFNSRELFGFVNHLSKIGAIKPNPNIKIVLGYKASKIPCGTVIGDVVIQNNLLYLHDWHVWNYLDNFLIDLSIFKYGNLIRLDSDIHSWGKANDHVFIHPPHGAEYFGNAYDDMKIFDTLISKYFKQ
jgi:hypothetical protein